MRRHRFAASLAVLAALASACGKGGGADPTTTTATTRAPAPATTTVPATTTTVPATTTTEVIAPVATEVVLTVPSTVPAPSRAGLGPCKDPGDSQYCVWGNHPIEGTVNDSGKVTFNTGLRQVFTATQRKMTSVEIVLESRTIGALDAATETTPLEQLCVRVTLMSGMGLPVATAGLVSTSTKGVRQQINVPLAAALVRGAEHKVEVKKEAACLGKDLATYVATASDYLYPRKYGRMSVDGVSTAGSLWARVE